MKAAKATCLSCGRLWITLRERDPVAKRIEALEKALRECQKAILTLPIDALGYGEDDAGRWPLRDELLQSIAVLAPEQDK